MRSTRSPWVPSFSWKTMFGRFELGEPLVERLRRPASARSPASGALVGLPEVPRVGEPRAHRRARCRRRSPRRRRCASMLATSTKRLDRAARPRCRAARSTSGWRGWWRGSPRAGSRGTLRRRSRPAPPATRRGRRPPPAAPRPRPVRGRARRRGCGRRRGSMSLRRSASSTTLAAPARRRSRRSGARGSASGAMKRWPRVTSPERDAVDLERHDLGVLGLGAEGAEDRLQRPHPAQRARAGRSRAPAHRLRPGEARARPPARSRRSRLAVGRPASR